MSLHPSVAAVRRAVRRDLADLEPGATVVVACSGGADSLALLAATTFEARAAGWCVVGATVDHGLQAGSAAHAQRVVTQMTTLGADESLALEAHAQAAGQGPEATARHARYAALDALADRVGVAAVLLGHTRDDQAETVLLGLARGSGGRSLAGMRPRVGRYRRPLLELGRADTVAACEAEGIRFWTDPHNADRRFTRTRVRTRVLPLLEAELGPGVARALARTAEQLRGDMDLLDELAERARAELGGRLPVDALAAQPAPVRRRVLRFAALAAGAPASELLHEHVLAMDALVTGWHGQRWVDLPGHLRLRRRGGELTFTGARDIAAE